MAISSEIIQKLMLLLRPYMKDEKERLAYLMRALGVDAAVLYRLVWDTPVNVFIPTMVKELLAFGEIHPGKPALCALLEVIREDVGVDVNIRINELIQEIKEELKKIKLNTRNWKNSSIQENNLQLKVAVIDVNTLYPIRKIIYRRIIEQAVKHSQLTSIGDSRLDATRVRLGILPKDAEIIEDEVLEPQRDYSRKLQQYVQVLSEIMQQEYPLSAQSRNELKPLEEVLEIREEDFVKIEEQFFYKEKISVIVITIDGEHKETVEIPCSLRVEELILEAVVRWNLPSNAFFGLRLKRNNKILELDQSIAFKDAEIESGDILELYPIFLAG